MTFTTFIKRPVLSTVISILIVLLGFIGLVSLPIEQYPNIAPPTVAVWTSQIHRRATFHNTQYTFNITHRLRHGQ